MERAQDITLRILPLGQTGLATADEGLSVEERGMLRAGEVVRRAHTDAAGDEWVQVYAPLRLSGGELVVEYGEPFEAEHTFIEMSHVAMIAATLGIVLVCGLIATGLQYSLVGRPLELLRDKARRAGEGDFSRPLVLRQNDEMGELAREINAMCDRIAAANRRLAEETEARITALEQLRHTDRLATVGQLAAGVAHELGTPLNVASARAELIATTELPRAQVVQNARVIGEQCDRITAIVQQLLDFSRRRRATVGLADLRHVVTRTMDLLSTAADKARVRLQSAVIPTPVLVRIDPNQMLQALANIALNGIQAMSRGGRLHVSIGVHRARPPAGTAAADDDYACITVEDNGTGIAADHLPRIFEPFFTTKGVGEGTGLGLAVADGIVAEHGGWIAVDSAPGRGSRFSIFLPLAQAAGATDVGAA
jgi:two-component system NtrC family sensor kinase